MICILEKGKQRRVIASRKAADWKLLPGDEYFPDVRFTTEAAFIGAWKKLERNKYKLTKFTSGPPKSKSRKKYTAKVVTKKIPEQLTSDAALHATAISWLSTPDGSELTLDKGGVIVFLDSEGGKPKPVAKNIRAFLTLLSRGKTKITDLDDTDAFARADSRRGS